MAGEDSIKNATDFVSVVIKLIDKVGEHPVASTFVFAIIGVAGAVLVAMWFLNWQKDVAFQKELIGKVERYSDVVDKNTDALDRNSVRMIKVDDVYTRVRRVLQPFSEGDV